MRLSTNRFFIIFLISIALTLSSKSSDQTTGPEEPDITQPDTTMHDTTHYPTPDKWSRMIGRGEVLIHRKRWTLLFQRSGTWAASLLLRTDLFDRKGVDFDVENKMWTIVR